MGNPWFIGISCSIIAGLILLVITPGIKYRRRFVWLLVGAIVLTLVLIPTPLNQVSQTDTATPSQTPITTTTPPPSTSSTAPTTQPTSSTIPIMPGENVSVEMQPSSNVLAFSKFDTDEGLYFTTTYTLTGYVTAVIKNPTPNDVNIFVTIDFQLPGVPSVSSSTIKLTNNKVSWTLIVANENELKFQTSQWGLTLSAGQILTLPTTLTLSITQRSAITDNPWQQSYQFTVSASIN